MASKKEIDMLLEDLGLTRGDMDKYYDDLVETNGLVKRLKESNVSWEELNLTVIKSIPEQKAKDIQRIEEEKRERAVAKEKERLREEEERYYEENYEKIILDKIMGGEDLSEEELRDLVNEYDIDEEEGEEGRWDRDIETIVEILGETFSINWRRGLTEMQENYYGDQPVRVKKKEEMVKVVSWVVDE